MPAKKRKLKVTRPLLPRMDYFIHADSIIKTYTLRNTVYLRLDSIKLNVVTSVLTSEKQNCHVNILSMKAVAMTAGSYCILLGRHIFVALCQEIRPQG